MTGWKEMRAWCVESARTAMKMPKAGGPKAYGSNWPDMQFERAKDYAPEKTPIRLRATARQISRMEAFMGLVNKSLDEEDRKEVYRYGLLIASPRRSVARYCRENGTNHGEFNRRLQIVFERLSRSALSNRLLVPKEAVALVPELDNKSSRSEVERSPTFTRQCHPDTRTPEQKAQDRKALIDKLQKGNIERARRKLREKNGA